MKREKQGAAESVLTYILSGLVPFSEANLKLLFKPNLFFDDIEKISRKRRQTIRNAYYKSIRDGLIIIDDEGIPRLTEKGRAKIVRYKPVKLSGDAKLLIIFDIPEAERSKRRHLRLLLKELKFTQIQKSVWSTPYDHRRYIKAEIKQYGLENYVKVYEAQPLEI